MYQNLNLEEIKKFLKYIKQDIIVTKLNRNIVASEFHIIGIIEVLKNYESLKTNYLTQDQYFWLKNPNIDTLLFASMAFLGVMWYHYQNNLNDLYETMNELNLKKDKQFLIK